MRVTTTKRRNRMLRVEKAAGESVCSITVCRISRNRTEQDVGRQTVRLRKEMLANDDACLTWRQVSESPPLFSLFPFLIVMQEQV